MKHQRAFKYRFYPTPEQVDLLSKTFGCARYIYNWGLQLKSDAWTLRQERVSYADMAGHLTNLKKQDETAWLNEVSSVALQQSLRHLDTGLTPPGRGSDPCWSTRAGGMAGTLSRPTGGCRPASGARNAVTPWRSCPWRRVDGLARIAGVVHDRDVNAARNILAEVLKVLAGEKRLPADYREIAPARLFAE